MSEIDLKKKYLRRARHLTRRDGGSTTNRRLQASVEPIGSTMSQRDLETSPALEVRSPPRISPTLRHSHPLSMPSLRQFSRQCLSGSHQEALVDTTELEAQLRRQTDVNRELKRLLVASVGCDLELRLEQIAREKAELSQDLDLSLQQVMSNSEELDQVSIECDIWRSKFIASRVMIDELASWKAELSLQLRESRKALQHLMQERGDIARELSECSAHLQSGLTELGSRPTYQPQSYHVPNTYNVATVSPVQYSTPSGLSLGEGPVDVTALDLAHSNTIAARDLNLKLHRATVRHSGAATRTRSVVAPCVVEPTAGEQLAQRVMKLRVVGQRNRASSPPLPKLLLTDEDLVHHRSSAASVGSSLPPLSRRLFHFGAKALEDPFRMPFHCSKCRGKIMVV